MKEKKTRILLISLICLVVVLGVVCTILLINNNKKNKNDDKPKSSEKIKKDDSVLPDDNTKPDDTTKPDEKDLASNVLTIDEERSIMSVIGKYYFRVLSWYGKDHKFTDNKVDGLMGYLLYSYMVSIDGDNYIEHFDTNEKWTFTKQQADSYFKKAFNMTPKKYEDILCPEDNEVLVIYDDVNEKFIFDDNHPGHGLAPIDYLDYYIASSTKKDNIYTVSIIFLYGNEMDGYYINDQELDLELDDAEDYAKAYKSYFKNNIKKYLDVPKYTYVFEKSNGNYFIKEFKLEK